MNDATQFFDTTAVAAGYEIERSLRFNSADSAYLSQATARSPAANTSITFSFWLKLARVDADQQIIWSNPAAGFLYIAHFGGLYNGAIYVGNDSLGQDANAAKSDGVLRDPSAWYHILYSRAHGSNGILYINGVQQTTQAINTANVDFFADSTRAIGRRSNGTRYADSYLADFHCIDGQALTPSSFGYTDSNGVWQPIEYTGTYGTNGFHLPFSDNSTAAALGTDTSGAGNNWTVNNISVAAGSGNDSLVDTPTSGSQVDTGLGGQVTGNYCTWNPLIKSTYATISNGNLDILSSNNHGQTLGTIGISSGKWYWEITKSTSGNPFTAGFGVMEQSYKSDTSWVGSGTGRNFIYLQNGDVNWYDGSAGSGAFTNSTLVNGIGVWMFALDLDNQKFWFGKDGVWYSRTGSTITGPSSGLNAPFTSFNTGSTYFPFHNSDSTAVTYVANFGQRPFAYTAPSGFKALCTTNLASTAITTSGSYTGNGLTNGPFVYLNGVPTAMTVNGNPVTFGTEADKLSNGFKVRTTNTTYNQNAVLYNYSITSTGDPFKAARAQSNP